MRTTQQTGQDGEEYVAEHVACPNCGKSLMKLPKNYPLFDVQCTGCSFRAQIKTNNTKPKPTIFGAGWDILGKVLKSGYMVPPLIVNFKWLEKDGSKRHEIRFYPFIPKANLYLFKLKPTAQRANWKMFNYVHLDKLPHFILVPKK